MIEKHILKITKELNLQARQVAATAILLEEGGTVPFIARYRKEKTGELDEVQITAIRDRIEQLGELDKRRDSILSSLKERNLLTDALQLKIDQAETMSTLEDIYLPFRPKKRTRATIAKEKASNPSRKSSGSRTLPPTRKRLQPRLLTAQRRSPMPRLPLRARETSSRKESTTMQPPERSCGNFTLAKEASSRR